MKPLRSIRPGAPDDRRRFPRLRCRGVAEIRFLGENLRVTATLLDLSAGGCCVDTDQDLPLLKDAKVEIHLTVNRVRLSLQGVLRNARRKQRRGGIEFREVSERKAEQIRAMVRELVDRGAAVV